MSLRILLILILILASWRSQAMHLPGGSITYTCLGGNMFEIKLSLLRECSGEPMINHSLSFKNSCGVDFIIANIEFSEFENVSQLCPTEVQNSTCSGGTLPGFELYQYVREVFLSPCDTWTIHWSTCCRQSSLNVAGNQGLYLEMKVSNITEPCDSSPVFTNKSIPHVCIGQPVSYDAGATDPDAHQLVYTFIDARYASPEPISVAYVFPNYGGEPVAGMTLDQVTGQIDFTPIEQGYIVVAVQVEEFNSDGVLIGMVMRDFSFIVYSCTNNAPDVASGNFMNATGSASIAADRTVRLCNGSGGCVSMEHTDPDAGQQISITTNVQDVLPGVMIETSWTGTHTTTLCWSMVDMPPGEYNFVLTATDDNCPLTGSTSFTYLVIVDDPSAIGENGTAMACILTMPFALIDSLPGDPPTGGQWSDPQGQPHNGFFNNETDGPGIYTYMAGAGECSASLQLEISFLEENDPVCIISSIRDHSSQENGLHPNPTTGTLYFEDPRSMGAIEILDRSGRVVQWFEAAPGRRSIELASHLPDGVYMILSRTDHSVWSRRFLLAR